jgi:lipopolysaccharide/colanic/teichoic acid biosynthesis glycosyltransferase
MLCAWPTGRHPDDKRGSPLLVRMRHVALKQPFCRAGGGWKRAFDCGAALIALVIMSPMMVMIALLVLITMGRPIFSRHRCIGLNGAAYICWKFRTVESITRETSDDATCQPNAASCSARLGIVLRESGLDVLPQLFNVLCGHVGFVGPQSPMRWIASHCFHATTDNERSDRP